MATKTKSAFLLKDQLFNKLKVTKIANEIKAVYPQFESKKFINRVTKKFPELELLERLLWIRDCLRDFLPGDYTVAVGILLESLPPPCDPALSDNDFGDFIYGPYGAYVAEYGCNQKNLQFSLDTIKEMTTRFSCEFPIRSFINTFPRVTLGELQKWTTDKHYHVRRLASEGTRVKLPWAKNIIIDYTEPLPILDTLYADTTRFVTRSVANHMNDISKIDPQLVITTLKRWQKSGKQSVAEMQFIVRHSLRTLEKQGYPAALTLLGFAPAEVKLTKLQIKESKVVIGGTLEFSFNVTSTARTTQSLLIDYHLYFKKKNGALTPKTFKITVLEIVLYLLLLSSSLSNF